jgi:hypothetical protein
VTANEIILGVVVVLVIATILAWRMGVLGPTKHHKRKD